MKDFAARRAKADMQLAGWDRCANPDNRVGPDPMILMRSSIKATGEEEEHRGCNEDMYQILDSENLHVPAVKESSSVEVSTVALSP